jgi:hypothetical protein
MFFMSDQILSHQVETSLVLLIWNEAHEIRPIS